MITINASFKEAIDRLIYYTTEDEKEQYLQRYEVLRKAQLNTLKKWYNLKEDYKTQLTEYLKVKNLNWILDKIAEKEN